MKMDKNERKWIKWMKVNEMDENGLREFKIKNSSTFNIRLSAEGAKADKKRQTLDDPPHFKI